MRCLNCKVNLVRTIDSNKIVDRCPICGSEYKDGVQVKKVVIKKENKKAKK